MTSNTLLLRRYAFKPTTAQQPVGSYAGVMVHRLIHNAMYHAADEAGLIPHDQPGQEQYHTFAKYRDLAHQELSNPDSPFTKMFNRHKGEISRVPNPQEHLKNALTPMFKYLSQHGDGSHLPIAEPIHEEGESEPVDLLGDEHHPLKESGGGGFEFKPRVPSGFVELPKPQPKRKPSPIRNDVYKSIAEHEDMGWSAPNKLKDYLVEKHGITPQEAATHIANFRRRSKKPAAPPPVTTKRVWPPIQRKTRRYDPTDLMAIPKRYMRVGDPTTHDVLLKEITNKHEVSGLGPFADFLEEQGAPGYRLARAAFHNYQDPENLSPPLAHHMWWGGHDWTVPGFTEGTPWFNESGEVTRTDQPPPEAEMEISPEISRPYTVGGYRTGLLKIVHSPQNEKEYDAPHRLAYSVPVESRRHLRELTTDLPEGMRNSLWGIMAPHLREDHEQQTPTNTQPPSDDPPVKMGGYRAPAKGVIVRGTQYKGGELLPDMESKFMNPRRKLARQYKNLTSHK